MAASTTARAAWAGAPAPNAASKLSLAWPRLTHSIVDASYFAAGSNLRRQNSKHIPSAPQTEVTARHLHSFMRSSLSSSPGRKGRETVDCILPYFPRGHKEQPGLVKF